MKGIKAIADNAGIYLIVFIGKFILFKPQASPCTHLLIVTAGKTNDAPKCHKLISIRNHFLYSLLLCLTVILLIPISPKTYPMESTYNGFTNLGNTFLK